MLNVLLRERRSTFTHDVGDDDELLIFTGRLIVIASPPSTGSALIFRLFVPLLREASAIAELALAARAAMSAPVNRQPSLLLGSTKYIWSSSRQSEWRNRSGQASKDKVSELQRKQVRWSMPSTSETVTGTLCSVREPSRAMTTAVGRGAEVVMREEEEEKQQPMILLELE